MKNGEKKLKLSVTTTSKKTYSSIEKAKSQSKNSVLIEKKYGRPGRKSFSSNIKKPLSNFNPKANLFEKTIQKETKRVKRLIMKKEFLPNKELLKELKVN